MSAIATILFALFGLSSPVFAGEDTVPRCDLNLARVGEVLPLNTETLPQVRIVHPGQAVTMEFVAGRTTIALNAQGVVVSVRCG
ncbi:MAG: hypothetical protein JXQ84_06460 [Rhodospirillaceae bacterium]|nr:hypothetical protein [Rhodospirillaceae bacterium]